MKVNIFKIPNENVESLRLKMDVLQMDKKQTHSADGWTCSFYLSTKNEIGNIAWTKDFRSMVPDLSTVKNIVFYAIYLCEKEGNCFALTYGKSHFYVRSYCDQSFGLEMAKRIVNDNEIILKATKRFSGKKKKEIKSYKKDTKLDNESGESVDYINAMVVEDKQNIFGEKSKFGSSIIVSREDLDTGGIPAILDGIINTLLEDPRFDIPKTEEIKDEATIDRYNELLLRQIKTDISSIDTVLNSHDLVGTDFVFSGNEKFVLHLNRSKRSQELTELGHKELKDFIETFAVRDEEIFNIKVEIIKEGQSAYTKPLYEMIEYMVPDENVVLEQGKWKMFNVEYLGQINEMVDSIRVDSTEPTFENISVTEPDFNDSQAIIDAGYKKADQDFSIIGVGSDHKTEAWDLQKGDTVYAVKFGTPQKLVYVCNQAVATLEIIRNIPSLMKLENPPKRYCLWLGFKREQLPAKISDVKSIILKQNIDMFARRCREIGLEPILKFSKKI